MSAPGTNAKCRPDPEMSAVWARPDIRRHVLNDANDPFRTLPVSNAAETWRAKQSNVHHGCERPSKSGQHAFDAVWRSSPAKPHGWSAVALTAVESRSGEVGPGRSVQR